MQRHGKGLAIEIGQDSRRRSERAGYPDPVHSTCRIGISLNGS